MSDSLKLFVDNNGIVRLKGRFENCALNYDEKFPALLRSDSYFTYLLIIDAHENVFHQGIEATLNYIRSKFWLIKGRKTVKNVLRKCVTCKRFQAKTLIPPGSPDLPDFRVNSTYCFQYTGLDYAGPLFVKDISNTSKVYILLLTCATSRAIHLELTPNMNVSAFLRAFRRFCSRRGTPEMIINDNFKTFKSKAVKRYMTQQGVSQKFILPASPWWGGFYERLVRSVKLSLKKVLGKSLLTYEELETVLCGIEGAINGRPLTYTSEDDLNETITPFHLMYGRDISKRAQLNFSEDVFDEINQDGVTKRVQYLQRIDDWKLFRKTYLNELRQHHIYRRSSKKSNEDKLIVGDVVLIKDDTHTPRSMWRIGKVERLVVGRDGKVRGADLAVVSKKGHRTTASRPVQKLIPFEIVQATKNDSNERETENNDLQSEQKYPEELRRTRSKRNAAIEGEDMRRLRDIYG